ncbi:DUF3288 family protein [Leptolyngbya sp. FACHB-261]|uniref:DUF3288 family protein n=1 Tax=Leptolyngbya sp. FACHB-261 TaxID=2692806 RepID=UPI001681F9CA|nr:DUF3288 family protein [Leptolyngbya sp. FACHB-261]MBD2101103.1 DUF3288 family protein [Leptolyngbya sp. FACHB-261]
MADAKNAKKDAQGKDQDHPLYRIDRDIVNQLLEGEPNDRNLAELARLRIRYQGFPGARDIQTDLDKVLQNWSLTEPELLERTRIIHAAAQVYRGEGARREDWA